MTRKLTAAATLSLVLICSAPSWARQDYAAYEGADAIQKGQGGTRVTKNDVDFWTTGTPPRRFQVIGIITDARKDRPLDGNVIGSKSVAKRAKEAGGDAVIVVGSSTAQAGMAGFANIYGGSVNAYGRSINRTTTQLLVVKYIPE